MNTHSQSRAAKPSRSTPAAALFTALVAAGLATSASSQTTFIKADNATALNLAGSYTAAGGPPTAADTLQIDSTLTASRTANLGDNVTIAGINQLGTATQTFTIANTANTTLTIGAGGITKSSTALLTLNNSTTLGGNQTWTIAAGSLQLAASSSLNTNGNTLSVIGAGALDVRKNYNFGSEVTIDSTLNINASGVTVALGGANTFNSLNVFNGKASGATINNFGVASNFGDGGTNTAIVLGNNGTNGVLEYTGTTASSNRIIRRDSRSAASGINVTTAGETLTLSGVLQTSSNATASPAQVNIGNNGWVFGGSGNLTLTGVISNATDQISTGTTVTKNDAGTLTLTAANTYTGTTTISAGTLQLGNGGTTGSLATTGSIVNNGNLTINRSNAVTQGTDFSSAAITGTGSFTQSGTGTTTLTAANTFSGLVTVNFGSTLATDATGTFGTGDISIATGGTLQLGNASSIADTANVKIDVGSSLLLVFTGTETVNSLSSVSGGFIAAGTYNTSELQAFFGGSVFAFDGTLNVLSGSAAAVPEPSTYAALAGLGILGFAVYRRRKQS